MTLPPTESSRDGQAFARDTWASRWVGILMGLTFAGSLVVVMFAGGRPKRRRRG